MNKAEETKYSTFNIYSKEELYSSTISHQVAYW